uniref:RdRp n=1 Tax=viral metagenome TaxID=1070528 RepID=A0A2V0RI95_9ZZZZ
MVRNKLIGWPHLITGMDRETNNMFLAVHAALAIGARDAKIPLEAVTKSLETRYGPCFFPYAERYQHTAKVMPMWMAGKAFFSQNVEPRCRMVVPSSKYMVIQNRIPVKKMLTALLASDIHAQDRVSMKRRIDSFLNNKDWETVSLDHSKFDQRHGLPRVDGILKMIATATGHPEAYQDFLHEFRIKNLVYYKDKAFFTKGDEILKSGISPTTLVGCSANVASIIFAMSHAMGVSYEAAWKLRGVKWDCLVWGDDTVLSFHKSIPFKAIAAGFELQKLKVEPEPTIKYLGNHYANGPFKGTMDKGYPIGRGVQQLFFPERVKVYPFSTIGYISRLEIIGSRAEKFHEITVKNFWDEALYGPPFAFGDRLKVLSDAVKKAEKYAEKISSLDDILLSLTHGTLDLGVAKIDIEGLEEILGLVQVDVSDPLKLLSEEAPTHKAISPILSDLLKGDIAAESKFQNYLSTNKGLTVRRGYPVY